MKTLMVLKKDFKKEHQDIDTDLFDQLLNSLDDIKKGKVKRVR